MNYIKFLVIISVLFITDVTYAQIGLSPDPNKEGQRGVKVGDVNDPSETFGNVFNNSIGLLFTIGGLGFIIYFIWGTVDWILSGGDKEKIAGARKKIVTAITGLVLLSLTFIVAIVLGQVLGIQELRQLGAKIPKLTD